jgi:hypothetical protein
MTFRRLWATLAVLLPVLGAMLAGLSTTDLTYHLRAGAEMLAGGGIPRVDTWTYTVAGEPWHDQQWGAQLLFGLVERVGGWTGLAIFRAALVGVTFGLVALTAVRRGAGVRTATGLTLAAFVVSAVALALRPQLLGMALFALTLFVVGERHRRPRLLWIIPILTLVWANLHGSFFLAPVLLGLAWVEDLVDPSVPTARRHVPLLVAVVSAAAAFVNPWGADVWAYAIGLTTSREVTSRVTEWQPTTVRDIPGLLFFGSVAAVVVLMARRGRATPWPTLLTLGVFAGLGLYAVRGVAWWPLIAAVAAAGLLADAPVHDGVSRVAREPRETPLIRTVNALLVGVIVLVVVVALPVWRPVDPGLQAPTGLLGQAPSGITAALRDVVRPGDRLFAPQVWGSWFEYTFREAPIGFDSRIELFPEAAWTAMDLVYDGGEGWERQLDAWGVTIVVIGGATDDPFPVRLVDAGWRQVFSDDDGAILVRSAG